MTDAAKNIINCVYEAKERYGKTIIIDAVAGAKTARLEEIGATNYKSYGTLASINKNLLKRLLEQLIFEKYLIVGDYQVIKTGDISALRNSDTKVLVKITDEDKRPETITKTKKKAKGTENLTSVGFKLFNKLRELRFAIAREENMPPYIVFNDKTLIDMAVKVPLTQQDMLMVSGVGDNKYAKYGERFIAVIEAMTDKYPELLKDKNNVQVSNLNEIHIDDFEEEKKSGSLKKKTGKKEFNLLREEADNYIYVDYSYISDIRDEMNRICTRDDIKKLAAVRLIEILVNEEYIAEIEHNGRYEKMPTEKGYGVGIKPVDRVSEKGYTYTLLMYPEVIQRLLVDHYVNVKSVDVTAEKNNKKDIGKVESSWLAERREKFAGAYMPWTNEEDQKLQNEFASNQFSIKDLSEIHGRTTGAIRARLKKLKLIDA